MRSSTALTWSKIEATFEDGYDGPDIYVVFSGGENGDSLIHENGYSLEDCKRFFDSGNEFFFDEEDASYEIRRADMENYKEYSIWKHANDDTWEVCNADFFNGSDTLVMVETKVVREFDCAGKHYKVFAKPNYEDRFTKEEKYKDLGKQKVVYFRFSLKDFVNVRILNNSAS